MAGNEPQVDPNNPLSLASSTGDTPGDDFAAVRSCGQVTRARARNFKTAFIAPVKLSCHF